MHGDQQSGLDPGHQGTDVEVDGQAELDRGHLAPVHQDRDRRLLGDAHLVPDQVHQLGAARDGQRTPGRAGQVAMSAPPGQQQAVQVDVQQPGGRGGRLTHRGVAGGLRQSLQGLVQAGWRGQDLLGQRLGRVRTRAEEQVRGGARARLDGRCHGCLSSIVVTVAPACGSMRTVSACRLPVSRTVTDAGGPERGTARTFSPGAG